MIAFKYFRCLLVVVIIVFSFGCMESSGERTRPVGLPTEAFWLGGPDGGVFLLLNRHDDPKSKSYDGAVYHPDGSIWYKGRFILEPAASAPVDPKNRDQFDGWDGTQILLLDGRSLVAK